MSYLINNWSFDPFLVVAIAIAIWHEKACGGDSPAK